MFHYYTKLGAKWVKLVQSLCHEFIMEFFATNAPDPLHWTLNSCIAAFRSVWVHLAMFHYYTKLGAKRVELVQLVLNFVPRSRIEIFCKQCTQSTPLGPKLMFWCVSYHLGAFWTVWLPYETRCKRAQLVQKFVPRNRVGVFRDECTRSTPLDPKLSFCCISYHLGAFGKVWLPYKTRCKMGRTSAKLRATKSLRNFSQRKHPIHPIGP